MDMVIKTEKITHVYSQGTPFEKIALRGVDFEVARGAYIGIIGQTGSGKSTFVQHLNGLIAPKTGKVFVDGEDIHASKAATRAARFKVGLVFQFPEYQLFEETVFADIAFGPKNMGIVGDEIEERVHEAARFVGLAEETLGKSPFELSGGNRRRAAIAGVIAMRPEVLILDEPTAGLDPHGRDELLANIDAYHAERGATIIIVTHSMEEAARRAERVAVFNNGEIAMYGTPPEIFRRGEELAAMGLGIPKAAQIAEKLRAAGVPIDGDIYTLDAMRDAIIALGRGGVRDA